MSNTKKNITDWLYHQQSTSKTINKIVQQIALSSKIVANRVKRAGIEDLLGHTDDINHHSEKVKMLDVVSNNIFIHYLSQIKGIKGLISEEDKDIITTNSGKGKYIVAFDPLDGSSNIDANVNIGSIFGIYKRNKSTNENNLDRDPDLNKDQNIDQNLDQNLNLKLVAAGYCLYGFSTLLVLSLGDGVYGFTLDENIGEFVLTHPNIKTPQKAKIYSVNEGNLYSFEEFIQNIIENYQKSGYSARYVGSMVADVHRTLLYGGIFMYPGTKDHPNGKLRYLYEIAPMSFLMQESGGKAVINLRAQAVPAAQAHALNYIPKTIHDRVPIFLGSIDNINDIIP